MRTANSVRKDSCRPRNEPLTPTTASALLLNLQLVGGQTQLGQGRDAPASDRGTGAGQGFVMRRAARHKCQEECEDGRDDDGPEQTDGTPRGVFSRFRSHGGL